MMIDGIDAKVLVRRVLADLAEDMNRVDTFRLYTTAGVAGAAVKLLPVLSPVSADEISERMYAELMEQQANQLFGTGLGKSESDHNER